MKNVIQTYIHFLVEEELRQTKSGENIEIKVIEDIEGDKNRGWIVHRFEAQIDGKPVGYLNTSFIPEERFKSHYKNLFDYVDKMTGKRVPEDWSDRKKALNTWAYTILGWPGLDRHDPPLESLDDEDLDRIEKEINKKAEEEYQWQFDQFKNYHVDKPLVDYIRVDEEHRRKGIGLALYEFAAKWLAQRGMKLYASGIQSNQAKAAWVWLRKNKKASIGTEKAKTGRKVITRTFLSYL